MVCNNEQDKIEALGTNAIALEQIPHDKMDYSSSYNLSSSADHELDICANVSQWTDEMLDVLFLTPFQVVIFTVLYPIVTALGLLGNVAFLVAVMCYKQMRTLTNLYLANLAVADLIHILTNAVFFLGLYFSSNGLILGMGSLDSAFLAVDLINMIIYYTSICIMTLVSFERFMGVCHPLRSHIVRSSKRSILLVALSWLLAALLVIFTCIGFPVTSVHVCIIWPQRDKYKSLPNDFSLVVDGESRLFIYRLFSNFLFLFFGCHPQHILLHKNNP